MQHKLFVPAVALIIGLVQVGIIIGEMTWLHLGFALSVIMMFALMVVFGILNESGDPRAHLASIMNGAVRMFFTPVEYVLTLFAIPVPSVLGFPVLAVLYIVFASIKGVSQTDALITAIALFILVVVGELAFSKRPRQRPR